jgi:hypothetical protein
LSSRIGWQVCGFSFLLILALGRFDHDRGGV